MKFSAPKRENVYRNSPGTYTKATADETLMDPLDRFNVYLAESKIPGAGEGTFAKRKLFAGDLIMMYAGVKLNAEVKVILPVSIHKQRLFKWYYVS